MGISRGELFARLGLLQEVEPLTDLAYRFSEQQQAAQSDQGAAAADPWHVSFHGSQFPGDAERACPRALLYRMLDIPRSTGSYLFSNRKLEQISDAGKDIEDRLVMKWYRAGYLLSPPPVDCFGNRQNQMVFEDKEVWLTSTVDALLLPPRSIRPVVCEVKTKYAIAIENMRNLIRGPDLKHVRQLKTQISMSNAHYTENPVMVERCFNTDRMAIEIAIPSGDDWIKRRVCPQHLTRDCLYEITLQPPEYGFIYYVSRDNPIDTREFYYELDRKFYDAGREVLAQARQAFVDNVLPHTNFVEKRYSHPFGWLWGDDPCKWCDYGDSCRSDNKAALRKGEPIALSESDAVLDAKAIKTDYDLDLVRNAVFQRWDLDLEEAA